MKQVIKKYRLMDYKGEISIPRGSKILEVREVAGLTFIIVLIDPEETELLKRQFEMFQLGQELKSDNLLLDRRHDNITSGVNLIYIGSDKNLYTDELIYVFEKVIY